MESPNLVGGNSQTGYSRSRESMGICNSPGIPFSKIAFSGNSSEFPYRGGILDLQGGIVLFTGGYCFIYREVPLHCATKGILTCGFKTRIENGR